MKSYDSLTAYEHFKKTGSASLSTGSAGCLTNAALPGTLPSALPALSVASLPTFTADMISTTGALPSSHHMFPVALFSSPLEMNTQPVSTKWERVPGMRNELAEAKDIMSHWEHLNSVPDPHLGKPLLDIRVTNAVKVGGRAVLTIGVMVDGFNLCRAYQESQQRGDFSIVKQEGARITGAWAGAAAIGLPLAKASATFCVPAGPVVSLGCGVVGGLAGSAIGYIGAGDLTTRIYTLLSQDKTDTAVNTSDHTRKPTESSSSSHATPNGLLFSKKATDVTLGYLYRGDSRTPHYPDNMHANGFKTKLFPDHEIINDVDPFPDTEFIATSKSKEVAQGYPEEVSAGKSYVYEINPQKKGIDLANDRLEVVVPKSIQSQDIKGAWEVDLTLTRPTLKEMMVQTHGDKASFLPDITHHDYARTFGEFIPNPNYKAPLAVRASQAVKVGGHGLMAVGMVIDSVNLFKAMDHSMATGDNRPAIQEATRIAAGWSGAAAVGIPLSKAAAAVCAPAGPPASLGCAVVGGIAGSVIGYVGASELVQASFKTMSSDDLDAKIRQLKI